MKRNLFFLFLYAASVLGMISCKKDCAIAFDADDYLIVGTYYGECGGNCATFYRLENLKIYEDSISYYSNDDIPFLVNPLDESKYQIAKELLTTFPNSLLDSPKRRYGCPDCGDQGGVFIQTRRNGEIDTWNIDTFDAEQNAEIIAYKKKVMQIVYELQ